MTKPHFDFIPEERPIDYMGEPQLCVNVYAAFPGHQPMWVARFISAAHAGQYCAFMNSPIKLIGPLADAQARAAEPAVRSKSVRGKFLVIDGGKA